MVISYNTLGDSMKIVLIDQYHVVIFLFKDFWNINFTDRDDLELYFKKIILSIEENHGVLFDGFLDITIYMDEQYGSVIEIEKDNLEYPYTSLGETEMNIHLVKNSFILYQVQDPFILDPEILKQQEIYYYRSQFYLKIQEALELADFLKVLEQGKIIYGNTTNNIVHYGQLVKV